MLHQVLSCGKLLSNPTRLAAHYTVSDIILLILLFAVCFSKTIERIADWDGATAIVQLQFCRFSYNLFRSRKCARMGHRRRLCAEKRRSGAVSEHILFAKTSFSKFLQVPCPIRRWIHNLSHVDKEVRVYNWHGIQCTDSPLFLRIRYMNLEFLTKQKQISDASQDVPESLLREAEALRAKVFNELSRYYRDKLKHAEYSSNLGKLMTMFHTMSVSLLYICFFPKYDRIDCRKRPLCLPKNCECTRTCSAFIRQMFSLGTYSYSKSVQNLIRRFCHLVSVVYKAKLGTLRCIRVMLLRDITRALIYPTAATKGSSFTSHSLILVSAHSPMTPHFHV